MNHATYHRTTQLLIERGLSLLSQECHEQSFG